MMELLKPSVGQVTTPHAHNSHVKTRCFTGLSYKMGKAYDKAEEAYLKSSNSFLDANSYPYTK